MMTTIFKRALAELAKRAPAVLAALWFAVAPALADQSSLFNPTSGSLPGLTMVNGYNSALNALNTCNSGSSAPTNQLSAGPSAGNCWYNTSTGAVQYYDGTNWLTVGYIDTTNHVWTPVLGGGAATNVASATTTNLCGASGAAPTQPYLTITGTTTITAFGSNCVAGQIKVITFSGSLTLTYNGTSLILPTAASIPTQAGDMAVAVSLGGGNWRLAYFPASGAPLAGSVQLTPQGRLTLTSGDPVVGPGAVSAATSVLYTPYVGNIVPLWNGSSFTSKACPELTNVLANSAVGNAGPAAAVAASVYDLYVWSNAGTCTLTRGPVWTNTTTRSAGAAQATVSGLITNNVNITNGPNLGFGTFVGTIATDAGGATVTFNPAPAAASGGPTNGAWVGLWNEYNRVLISLTAEDNKTTWTYATTTFAALDGSNNNRVTMVAGEADDSVQVSGGIIIKAANTEYAAYGVGLNSTSSPLIAAISNTGNTTGSFNSAGFSASVGPQVGQFFLQALQNSSNTTTATFTGSSTGGAGNFPTAQYQNLTALEKF